MTTSRSTSTKAAKKAASAAEGKVVDKVADKGTNAKENSDKATTENANGEAAQAVVSGQGVVADNRSVLDQNVAAANAGDSGPQTGVDAPEDQQQRSAARTVTVVGDSASPIEAPDAALQTSPPRGYDSSSTNAVASNAAISNFAGENHVGLVDEDGNDVDVEDVFNDPDGPQTFVTTKKRVYERFLYPGSTEAATRLLYVEGARVDVFTAARLKAAYAKQHADD